MSATNSDRLKFSEQKIFAEKERLPTSLKCVCSIVVEWRDVKLLRVRLSESYPNYDKKKKKNLPWIFMDLPFKVFKII